MERAGRPGGFAAVEADFNQETWHRNGQAATLPDEPAETEVLSAAWERYRLQYRRALDPSVSRDERRKFYSLELRPDLQAVRLASQRLIEMNLSSILSVPGRAQATTRRAHWAMRTLTISAVMLSILLALMIGRIILKPIRALTESVHEVERGNFDQAVPIHAHDELGALAKAFNTMAQRLRAYRRLDHERLVRTERTTQLAIDSLPDAVLVINPDGRIELSNSAARKLLRIMRTGTGNGQFLPPVAQRPVEADFVGGRQDGTARLRVDRPDRAGRRGPLLPAAHRPHTG